MAGVTNYTARQYNLKCISKGGNRVTVRIAPGFNVVDDAIWNEFVSKDGKKINPYVAELKADNKLSFGPADDDKEFEQDGDTKCKVKSVPMPKAKTS